MNHLPDPSPVVPRRGPYRFTKRGLRRVDVDVIDLEQRGLRCRACGRTWHAVQKWGRFAIRWWACPAGCNIIDSGLPR
jgi:hypothetical protein